MRAAMMASCWMTWRVLVKLRTATLVLGLRDWQGRERMGKRPGRKEEKEAQRRGFCTVTLPCHHPSWHPVEVMVQEASFAPSATNCTVTKGLFGCTTRLSTCEKCTNAKYLVVT